MASGELFWTCTPCREAVERLGGELFWVYTIAPMPGIHKCRFCNNDADDCIGGAGVRYAVERIKKAAFSEQPPEPEHLRESLRYPAGMPPPSTITDGFGQFWPARCPDCGAEMQVIRPGRAACSAECWITPDEGGGESRKEE